MSRSVKFCKQCDYILFSEEGTGNYPTCPDCGESGNRLEIKGIEGTVYMADGREIELTYEPDICEVYANHYVSQKFRRPIELYGVPPVLSLREVSQRIFNSFTTNPT